MDMGQIMEFTVLPLVFGSLFLGILVALHDPVARTAPVIGRDDAGRAVYRVIGYARDGSAITRPLPRHPEVSVLAVLTLMLGVLMSPAAVLVGHTARRRIRETGERGDRLAVIGLWLGYAGLLCLGVGALLVADALLL